MMQDFSIEEWVATHRNQESVHAFGFAWTVRRIHFLTLPPIAIPVARIELTASPHADLTGIIQPGTVSFVVKANGYVPDAEARDEYLTRVKAETIRQCDIHPGHAYRYLMDALSEHSETAEHEAITRGRALLRGGDLESQEAMVAFVESIE